MYVSPGPAPGYHSVVRGPLHPYQGFRPVQTGAASWSGYQGELSPELRDRQLEVLERRYQGARLPVHRAATIIQTAWREHVLRTKFRRMVELAQSVENMAVTVTRLSGEAGDPVRGAGASMEGAAARHIQTRRHMRRQQGGRMIQRSTSLRDHRRSGSWSAGVETLEDADSEAREATEVSRSAGSNRLKPSNSWTETRTLRTAADLQNKLNSARDLATRDVSPTCSPVPPCPPLRGRDFYPDQEPLYTCIPGPTRGPLARDSVYCSVRRPRRMPPRVPQRTVSFLGQEGGHVSHAPPPSHHVSPDPRELAPHQRPISISESNLPREPARHVSTASMPRHVSHSRSQSSPCHSKVSPLPPPPYVPPPSVHHRDPNEPLPPPPELDTGLPGPGGPPSDSVSSIDSGFRSSCSDSASSGGEASSPHSPCQPYPDPGPEAEAGDVLYQARSPHMVTHPEDPYSYWVGSPNILGSPDTAAMFYRSTVEPPAPLYERAPGHCCCGQAHCHAPGAGLNVYDSYQDVYEKLGHRQLPLVTSEHQSKPKKSVRIQLPQDQNIAPVTEDSETVRRRQYRVGLNIFNTNPKRGVEYLCKKDFLEHSPIAVAKFLLGRKGLSKKMLGEYICDLQKPFNMSVLHHFVSEIDFSGLHLDIALRQLLSEVSIPGEAQKIEKLVEVFAKRYIECNHMFVSSFKTADAIFILSYAMVLLNTDLHNKSIKPEKKMKQDDFLRNLRGVDSGADIDTEMLRGIYDRIKSSEFKPGSDHVTQVTKVQETMVGAKRPELNAAWRRLVCFCRVTEVGDINKKEKKDSHQRGLFLFNDLLVVTKAEKSKKKQLHQHRYSLVLSDLKVSEFRTQHFPFGVQLHERHTARIVASFACRSYNDQQRFLADIQESVAEVGEMERARIFINDIESMC